MKTNITRVLVWIFAAAMLGSFSLTPRLSYGLNAEDPAGAEIRDELAANEAYNDAYNRAFDAAYADQTEANNEDDESAQSCGSS